VIVGLGIDVAEVDRLKEALERRGERMYKRLFTSAEIAYCNSHKNSFERFAGRFAIKEAAMKALGTGWRRGVRWQDIEVVNQRGGKPTLRLAGVAEQIALKQGVKTINISITHSGNLAIGQVIFEN